MAVKVDTSFWTSVLPHLGHVGGELSSSARWLIGRVISNSSPHARHTKA